MLNAERRSLVLLSASVLCFVTSIALQTSAYAEADRVYKVPRDLINWAEQIVKDPKSPQLITAQEFLEMESGAVIGSENYAKRLVKERERFIYGLDIIAILSLVAIPPLYLRDYFNNKKKRGR